MRNGRSSACSRASGRSSDTLSPPHIWMLRSTMRRFRRQRFLAMDVRRRHATGIQLVTCLDQQRTGSCQSISLSAIICWIMPVGELAAENPHAARRSRRPHPWQRTAEPIHRIMCHPGRTEAHLRVPVAFIDLAEDVLARNEHVAESDLAVPADHRLVGGVDVPFDGDAGVSPGARKHGGATAVAGRSGGAHMMMKARPASAPVIEALRR